MPTLPSNDERIGARFEFLTIRNDVGQAATRNRALAGTLLLRGGVHGVFAVWLITRHVGWADIFEAGSLYALVDGTLGLVAGALFASLASLASRGSPRFLATMTFADAVGRLALGFALRAFPGIPSFPVTAASLFGAVGVSAAGLGVIAMTVWFIARVRAGRRWSIRSDELFDPLAVAALISFVVGYTLLVDPPATANTLRIVAAGVSGALTLVFVVASLGAVAHPNPA